MWWFVFRCWRLISKSLWLVLANGKDWSNSPPYHSFSSIFMANQSRTKNGMMFQDWDFTLTKLKAVFLFLLNGIVGLGSQVDRVKDKDQGLNCINIEVWWEIRDFIEEIWNQWPNCKRRINIRVGIDRIRG
jgi:hypothetical protein